MLLLFLGLTIHYLKFVPHFSTEAMPLCKLQKEVTFVWGEEQQSACPLILSGALYLLHFITKVNPRNCAGRL